MLHLGAIDLEILGSVVDVSAGEWDGLVGEDDPFLEHAFLATLEASGSVGASTGWEPRIVLVRSGACLVGAVPLYLKRHSYGEFVFDWSWASAAERAGIRYYPKLVAAIPFTPVTGQRLPVANGAERETVWAELLRGVRLIADSERASSVHLLFCTGEEQAAAAAHGYLPRLGLQFHWHNRPNRPFESFEDYLATFRAHSRKNVRRERRMAASHGLAVRVATGAELEPPEWQALHRCYLANVRRHRGIPYLGPEFFRIAAQTLAHRVVATLAYRGDQPIAGTLNFEKGTHLYGRYWGCIANYEMLHFELAYYRLIERAIARRHTRFEAGAQGEHKLARGLLPAFTHSAHWLRHPGLAEAVAHVVRGEAEEVEARARAYLAHSPFHAAKPGA